MMFGLKERPKSWSSAKLFKKLGLDTERNLKQDCADFYLLERVNVELPDRVGRMLVKHEEELAHEFTIYLDMAVGGEVRHAGNLPEGKEADYPPSIRPYIEECRVHQFHRTKAWMIWTDLRRALPTSTIPFIRDIAETFRDPEFEGQGVGGPGWADAANVLYSRLKGDLKSRTFVDRCWTLQHCHGAIFDKAYHVSGLKETLQMQAENGYTKLAREVASPGVRAVYEEWMLDQDYDPVWYGEEWRRGWVRQENR